MTTALSVAPQVALHQHAMPSHPVDVYLASINVGSRRTMRGALTTIARIVTADETGATNTISAYDLPWQQLRYQHAAAIRQELAARYAYSTANRMLSALRSVLKACWRMGLMTAEEYHSARSIENVKGATLPTGREISFGEITALLATSASNPHAMGRRDAALIALLYGCGLRRAEVVALDLDDYEQEQQRLRIRGKGNKQRYAYVADSGALAALEDWLAVRHAAWAASEEEARARQTTTPALFVSIRRGGHLTSERLTPEGVRCIALRLAERANVAKLSPHDFRRTFVGDLLDHGADIVTVAQLAGHANVRTTARYDRRGERVKRSAAGLLHVPYQRRG